MTKIITGTITVGVTLAANPTIIDGTVANSDGDAIYGSAAQTWTVANHGYLIGGGYLEAGLGIDIRGGAQITNAAHAYIFGNDGAIDVGGAATIDNAGGIYNYNRYDYGYSPNPAIAIAGAGTVINRAGAGIYGTYGGIVDESGHFNLLNRGVISGYQSIGVAAAGTITNARSGTIAGYDGVDLSGGTIDNAGLIENGHDYYGFPGVAIFLDGQAYAEIIEQKTGTLIGGIDGFVGGDTIDEAGITITFVKFAHDTLTMFDGSTMLGTLSLFGDFNTHEFMLKSDGHGGTDIELGAATFTGTYKHGVALTALNSTVAAQARINGISAGVERNFTLVNDGSLIATGEYSHGVIFSTSGQITNAGLIEGEIGIRATGDTITNTGLIKGKFGIDATGGTITNSGLIEGKTGIHADGGTIVNSGTIDGSGGIAIDLLFDAATTDIILEPGSALNGRIAGFETGDMIELAGITATGETFAHGILTLTNAGYVVDTIALDGVFNTGAFQLTAEGGGTGITIAPSETFTGHHRSELVLSSLLTSIASSASFANGLSTPFGRDWTVVNAGTLSGPDNGALLNAGNFTNTSTGTIIGATGVYVAPFFSSLGATLTNAGSIIGLQSAGVVVNGYGLNGNLKSGSISGAYAGVMLQFGTFSNAGQISGADYGVVLKKGTFSNTGEISGPTGLVLRYSGNLYNAGIIEGQNSAASAASTGIYIRNGNVTNAADGIISGDTGVDLLSFNTFTDAGTIATTLGTAGTAIDFGGEFATLVLDRGNVIQGAIGGFGAGDIIDFAATTITTDSFSNNILTLLDGTETIEALTLAGTYSQAEFTLIPEGSLGTDLALIAPAASPSMHFLRPAWRPTVTPQPFASAPTPPQANPANPSSTPIISLWLPLHQTDPTPLPPITLHL